MELLGLIIFFISCSNRFAISCIADPNGVLLDIELNDFKLDQFKTTIENLPSKMYDDDSSVCHVRLSMNHIVGKLTVVFTEDLHDTSIDQDIQLDTLVSVTELENIAVRHKLTYACSNYKCEVSFINQHIEWLLNAEYLQISNRLALLFFGDNKQSGKCFIENGLSAECRNNRCRADVFLEEHDGLKLNQSCDDNDENKYTQLHFTALLLSNSKATQQHFLFYCHYDGCNDESIVQNITKIFDEVYNITAVLTMLRYTNETENMTTDSMSSSTSSNNQQKTSFFMSTTSANPSTTNTNTVTSTRATQTSNRPTAGTNGGYRQQSRNPIIHVTLITFLFRLIVPT